MDSYDILVIILSVTLVVFLIVAIVATSLFIQILKKIRSITDSAQLTVNNIEEFTDQLRQAGKVTAVGSVIGQVFELFKKGRK